MKNFARQSSLLAPRLRGTMPVRRIERFKTNFLISGLDNFNLNIMLYSKEVIKHFQKPSNMGKMKNPDGAGEVGNPTCGDMMNIYIKVGKNAKKQEIIKDIKFETLGCVAAIATSSMITELAKGKTLDEAMKIEFKDVEKALGSLPPVKIHCADLAVKGLRAAIENYRKRSF